MKSFNRFLEIKKREIENCNLKSEKNFFLYFFQIKLNIILNGTDDCA